jgi:2'-5' RNA ligase
MKRLFIAVDVEMQNGFQRLTQQLKADLKNDDIVWVKNDVQHLTLRFLGETPEAKIPSIANALSIGAKSSQRFELQLDKMGVFGSKYAPAVLWYGFSEFSAFQNLFQKIERELVQIGLEENYGNFVPHITVGRIKKVDHKKRFWETINNLQPQFSQAIPVRSLKLMQSKLNNDGPVYQTLYEFELTN